MSWGSKTYVVPLFTARKFLNQTIQETFSSKHLKMMRAVRAVLLSVKCQNCNVLLSVNCQILLHLR